MAKKVLYPQQHNIPADTIKTTAPGSVQKSFTKTDTIQAASNQKDSLIKLMEQGYDATSYIYSIAGGPVPLSDMFLNPDYFKLYNNKESTSIKPDHSNKATVNNSGSLFTQTDYLLLVLLMLAGAIGFVRISTKNFINRLFSSVISYPFSRIPYNERNRLFNLNDLILLSVFYISTGIVFVVLFDYFKVELIEINKLLIYFVSVLSVFVAIQIYQFLVYLIGVFVGERKYSAEYLLYFNNIFKFLAILNVAILFGILFAPENTQLVFVLLILFIYLIALGLRVYKIISIFLQNRFSLFYLILYFCALEIVPILLFGKLFLGLFQYKIAHF